MYEVHEYCCDLIIGYLLQKNNIKMHRKENLFPHYDSSKMRTIPCRTKAFIGINVCEIRDCQNRKTFRPTKTHLQQVLVA